MGFFGVWCMGYGIGVFARLRIPTSAEGIGLLATMLNGCNAQGFELICRLNSLVLQCRFTANSAPTTQDSPDLVALMPLRLKSSWRGIADDDITDIIFTSHIFHFHKTLHSNSTRATASLSLFLPTTRSDRAPRRSSFAFLEGE